MPEMPRQIVTMGYLLSALLDAREVNDEALEERVAELVFHGDSIYVDAELVSAIEEAKERKL